MTKKQHIWPQNHLANTYKNLTLSVSCAHSWVTRSISPLFLLAISDLSWPMRFCASARSCRNISAASSYSCLSCIIHTKHHITNRAFNPNYYLIYMCKHVRKSAGWSPVTYCCITNMTFRLTQLYKQLMSAAMTRN